MKQTASKVAPQSFLSYRRFRHLKWSIVGLLLTWGGYVLHQPIGGHNGGTAFGYTLGAICAGMMLWLTWFGARKRHYTSHGVSLRGWLSAHVYLRSTLILMVPFHSGFQFGWNLHTSAYALMTATILTGFLGVVLYIRLPELMTRNRQGRSIDSIYGQISEIDTECRTIASDLPNHYAQATAIAINETTIGGNLWRQWSGKDPNCGTRRALTAVREDVPDLTLEEQAGAKRLRELLGRKTALLKRVRRDVRYQSLLTSWLIFHIPLSIGALVAVAAHVFSVFYFW